MRYLATGIAPDFRAGAFVMGERIIHIGKLVQHNALALGLQLHRHIACELHAAIAWGQYQLGAKSFHGLASLQALVFRHDQHHFVATHGGGHGQGDAGVARSRLDQGIARLDIATGLGPLDHGQRWPVFYRPGGGIAFQLYQYGIAGIARQTLELNQRRIADKIFQGFIHKN